MYLWFWGDFKVAFQSDQTIDAKCGTFTQIFELIALQASKFYYFQTEFASRLPWIDKFKEFERFDKSIIYEWLRKLNNIAILRVFSEAKASDNRGSCCLVLPGQKPGDCSKSCLKYEFQTFSTHQESQKSSILKTLWKNAYTVPLLEFIYQLRSSLPTGHSYIY